ncbi:MAG: hypothetical protein J6Y20_07150 [Lachnospiraceae bacterium]|nr:hypothetical protein [Lachnospiraceae bacterium]
MNEIVKQQLDELKKLLEEGAISISTYNNEVTNIICNYGTNENDYRH